MEWCLTKGLQRSLRVLGVQDNEVDALLQEREQLWQPTSGPPYRCDTVLALGSLLDLGAPK